MTNGTGSMDNAQQRKAPRSGSAQRQCARHIVQQGNLIYCGTTFHNEWHTGFVHGPPEDVSLQGRKTGPLLGLPTWRHAGPAVRFPQKRPQRIGLRTSRKSPPLSQLRSKSKSASTCLRPCAADWKLKRWRSDRRLQKKPGRKQTRLWRPLYRPLTHQ